MWLLIAAGTSVAPNPPVPATVMLPAELWWGPLLQQQIFDVMT